MTLLAATRGHPLVSVKGDAYWGVHPTHGGENRLAALWEELRDEVQQTEPTPNRTKV
jgi:predicted NAD-dependent protein-ADP-ribosyltransferase YbiA (DUF1768 family)